MSDIVLWKLKDLLNDNVEMDIKKAYIVRDVVVKTLIGDTVVESEPKQQHFPLYVDGSIVPDDRLAILGLQRVGYTQEQLDEKYYGGLYTSNPDLVTRVTQFKAYLDELGVAYDASLDTISAAILSSDIEDKATYGTQVTGVYNAIITNLECCGSPMPHMEAALNLGKLIQYLPEG